MTECWKTGRLVRKLEDAKKLIYVVIPEDFFPLLKNHQLLDYILCFPPVGIVPAVTANERKPQIGKINARKEGCKNDFAMTVQVCWACGTVADWTGLVSSRQNTHNVSVRYMRRGETC